MKIVVTGSNGLLGTALRNRVGNNPDYIWGKRKNLNVENELVVQNFFDSLHLQYPGEVIAVHLAAYTATSKAEVEREKCYRTNVIGTRNIAKACPMLLYISTDHVFDGNKGNYVEKDEPCPWNHYGWTKLMGEKEAVLGQKDSFVRIIRCTFRPKPFPYPVAWNNAFTSAIWVDDMAEALEWCIKNFDRLRPILHIGGKRQDYHAFAIENGPVTGKPAPSGFPKDLSLDSSNYTHLRSKL
jgi:dTDP-4-dehydrorhamnose reductase